MSLRHVVITTILGATVGNLLVPFAQAEIRWRLGSRQRVAADPNGNYVLSERHGPWMILSTSFAGTGAEEEADELVLELRRDFQLPAYKHKKHYDYSQPVRGLGLDKYGKPKMMRYRSQGAFDEIAVLVGNFDSLDDLKLQKTLTHIKYARPSCLQLVKDKRTTQRFAGLRALQKRISGDEKKRRKGPMGQAFVTRNPLLPAEMFAPKGVDNLVLSMNRGVKYSLLDCPSRYTVRVATFRGNVVIDQQKVREINSNGRMESRLIDAAEKAHTLTMALRKKRIEAYEFHDRHESIVTVGSFDSVGRQRSDGKTEITNSAILRLMNKCSPTRLNLPGGDPRGLTGLQPKTVGGIPLDVQPYPMEVPRRSIAADYARSNRRFLR